MQDNNNYKSQKDIMFNIMKFNTLNSNDLREKSYDILLPLPTPRWKNQHYVSEEELEHGRWEQVQKSYQL